MKRVVHMSLGKYAANTSVPVERSRAELERILTKYGASKFGTMSEPTKAIVYFEVKGRQVQWTIPMPSPSDKAFTHKGWRLRVTSQRDKLLDTERKRRWRVGVITVKAMLEAVESKLLTFDQAFLPHIVIPGTAKTIGEALSTPKLDALYSGEWRPALLAENPQ